MNEVIIKDNWLPNDLCNFLYNNFLYQTPHLYGHTSNDTIVGKERTNQDLQHFFYKHEFDQSNIMINFLCYKLLSDYFKNDRVRILRVYINIQHKGQNGNFHTDDGTTTALWFPCFTNSNGGYFEYKQRKEDTETIKIPYVQNRLILFPANFPHQGIAFTDGTPRISLAFKIQR